MTRSTSASGFSLRQEPLLVESGPLALTYTPSAAGDVAAIANASTGLPDAGTTRTFQHDLHDRLVSSPGWLSYGHDGAGNRVSQTVAGAPATYSYKSHRMAYQLVDGKARLGFGYDLATNVSAIVLYDGSGAATQGLCLRHDPLRRLTLFGWGRAVVMTPGDGSCHRDSDVIWPHTRFEYDARNRRVARQEVSTGKWTQTVFDAAGNPLSELAKTSDAANPWRKVRDYVWLDGRPLAQIEYPGPAGSGEGYAYYFHVDHLGLPRALSNEAGQVVWSASVTPYGEVAETTATDPLSGTTVVTNLRLPGQYDERLFAAAGISGMQGPYYNRHRWYLPSIGRYMERTRTADHVAPRLTPPR